MGLLRWLLELLGSADAQQWVSEARAHAERNVVDSVS
jgi:hypothetical protein